MQELQISDLENKLEEFILSKLNNGETIDKKV